MRSRKVPQQGEQKQENTYNLVKNVICIYIYIYMYLNLVAKASQFKILYNHVNIVKTNKQMINCVIQGYWNAIYFLRISGPKRLDREHAAPLLHIAQAIFVAGSRRLKWIIGSLDYFQMSRWGGLSQGGPEYCRYTKIHSHTYEIQTEYEEYIQNCYLTKLELSLQPSAPKWYVAKLCFV